MTWLLFLIMVTTDGAGLDISAKRYPSKSACQQVAEQMIQANDKILEARCVPERDV